LPHLSSMFVFLSFLVFIFLSVGRAACMCISCSLHLLLFLTYFCVRLNNIMIIINRRTLHVVDARHCLVRNIAVVGDNVLVSQIFYVSLPVPNDHSRHRAATQHREMIESLYTHHKAPVRPSVRLSVCLSHAPRIVLHVSAVADTCA